MTPTFVAKLGFIIQKTDVDAQNINNPSLVIYGMILAGFLIQNKLGKIQFFEKTFLFANTSIKMILEMLFLTILDADMQFGEKSINKGVTRLLRPYLLSKR